MCVLVAQLCPTLCDPMDGSPQDSSVHGIFQARILEWIAISFSRVSSRPRDWNWVSCTAGRFFTIWAMREEWEGFNSTQGFEDGERVHNLRNMAVPEAKIDPPVDTNMKAGPQSYNHRELNSANSLEAVIPRLSIKECQPCWHLDFSLCDSKHTN